MAYKAEFRQEITAKDGTKKVLGNLQNNIKRTGRAGKTAGAAASGGFQSMLGPLVAVAASVMALKKLLDLSKEGAQANAVEAAFDRLNKGGAKLLATMREKSGGILDDTSLQMISNKLSAVTQNTETMGRVAQSALKIAAATGKDYKTTLESLTQAIVTGRSASLASLGIVVDAKKVQAEYAATLGKTAKELTQAEKKTAAMNGALAESERQFGAVNTLPLEDGVARLTTKFENLKSSIAQTTSNFLTFVIDSLEGIDRVEQHAKALDTAGVAYGALGDLATKSKKDLEALKTGLEGLIPASRNSAEAIRDLATARAQLQLVREDQLGYSATAESAVIQRIERLRDAERDRSLAALSSIDENGLAYQRLAGIIEDYQALDVHSEARLREYEKALNAVNAALKEQADKRLAALLAPAKAAAAVLDNVEALAKAEAKRTAQAETYYKIQDGIAKLRAKEAILAPLEAQRLKTLELQALAMRQAGTATQEMFNQWEQARGVDAVLAKVKGLRDTLKEISAGDVMRGLLGITKSKTTKDDDDTVSYGPSRAERAEQARQALEVQIEAGNDGIKAHREMLDRAAAEDLDRVKRVAKEAQQIQAKIYDFEQALAGKRATEEDLLEAERTKRLAALTQEGGLESLENFAAAKKAIELWYDEETRRIIREREDADFRRRLEETRRNTSELGAIFQGVAGQNLAATAKWNQGISATGQGITNIGSALTKTDSETGKLTSSTSRYAAAGGAALGAAAAWIKGERKKAVVLALMEAALSAAAFATYDYWAGAGHAAAAGLFGAIAGGAGGGRGRKASTVYRAPEKAASSPSGSAAAGNTYVFNVRGFIHGDQKVLAKGMADTLNAGVGLATLDSGLIGAGGQI